MIVTVFTLACIVCATPPAENAAAPHRLAINPDVVFQTIDHFGASDCWSMEKVGAWSDDNKNRVADLLFSMDKGIGLSCWRFNLGGGLKTNFTEPWRVIDTFETGERQYDWTRVPGQRWFLRAAKARGVPQFLAFVNSPPARMTRNGATRCTADVGATNLKEGWESRFARYMADILKHFRDNPDEAERVDFNYISPVNEPHVAWDAEAQEGNRASNTEIKAIVNALWDELRRQGLHTRISAPEANNYNTMWCPDPLTSPRYGQTYGRYIDDFCGDPAINEKLGKTLCAHAYWSEMLDNIVPVRKKLRANLDEHPGWKFWQSEYCAMTGPNRESGNGRDLTMETALWVARLIHFDMTVTNASAWDWWTAVSHCNYKDGLIYTDYDATPGDNQNILPAKLLWAFGNFSRFVRPGMVRVELKDANDPRGLMASAYTDAEKKKLVVVLVNAGNTPAPIALEVPNSFAHFTPYITSDVEADNLRPCPPFTESESYLLPARSIVTLVSN